MRLPLAAALVLSLGAGPVVTATPRDERPNILVLFADDMRADTIAAWGNPHIRTPHLDALVARGTSLRRNYCLGSPHGAVCIPSRAMLMTGRSYHQLDLGDMTGCRTLGECLGEAGYRTFATGKWHNGRGAFQRTFQSARNVMFSGMSDHVAVPVVDWTGTEFEHPRTAKRHSSELFADSAIEFLAGHAGDEPFFAYVAFTAPHDPRDPPRPWAQPYYADLPPLPRNFLPQQPWDIGMMTVRDEQLAPWPRTAAVVRQQLAEYYGLIEHLDAQIGRILTALEACGELENTLVVFAADHGLALGSHGLLGKQSVFEHSLRAPLILAGPRIPQGTSTTALTYLNDLYPTLLGMGGAKGDEHGLVGRDLGPLLRGETAAVRDTLFLSMGTTQRAVTDGRWKLIRYPEIDRLRLFDLASDPHELVDLSSRTEHAERLRTLDAELAAWQERAGDTAPLVVDEPHAAELDLTGAARGPDRWQPRWIRAKYFGQR